MISYQYTPFEDRDVQYPGKRFITRPDSSIELCTIARTSNGQDAEGVIYNSGTPLDAQSLNDQLNNIKNVFDSVGVDLSKKQATLNAGQNVTLTPQPDGTVTIDATGGGGGGSYTAGENIDISAGDVISGKRVVNNILFGGDDLTETPVNYNLFSASSMIHSVGDGFVIPAPGGIEDTLSYTPLRSCDNWETETFDLYIKINIDGVLTQHKITGLSYANSISFETFTLEGVDFTISSIGITSNLLELSGFTYDDTQETHTCYIVGLAMETEDSNLTSLSLNNKDLQIAKMIFNSAFYQELTSLYDVDVTSPADGQVLRYDIISGTWKNGDAASYTDLTTLLTAGSTSVTFTNAAIRRTNVIEVFANAYGVNLLWITSADGTATLTFGAYPEDVIIKMRLS